MCQTSLNTTLLLVCQISLCTNQVCQKSFSTNQMCQTSLSTNQMYQTSLSANQMCQTLLSNNQMCQDSPMPTKCLTHHSTNVISIIHLLTKCDKDRSEPILRVRRIILHQILHNIILTFRTYFIVRYDDRQPTRLNYIWQITMLNICIYVP